MKNSRGQRFEKSPSVARMLLLLICILETIFVQKVEVIAEEIKSNEPIPVSSPITAVQHHAISGEWLAATDGDIAVYSPDTKAIARRIRTDIPTIHDMEFSRDQKNIAVVGGVAGETGKMAIYSWPEGKLVLEKIIATDVVYGVTWNLDQTLIANASLDGNVVLCDAKTLETKRIIEAHPGGCTSVVFSKDNSQIISGGRDMAIRFWDIGSGRAVRTLSQHSASVLKILAAPILPGKNALLASLSLDRTIRLWDMTTGRMIRFVRLPAFPIDAAWEDPLAEDLFLWAICEDGRARRLNLQDASIEQDIFATPHRPHALACIGDQFIVGGSETSLQVSKRCSSLSPIKLSDDGRDFVLAESGENFRVRGFNYDHDAKGNLLEDYWQQQWPKIEEDFGEMQRLGANTVRIHLQFSKFMDSPSVPNEPNLQRWENLVQLAERYRLYLDVTGLGCYHQQDVPVWYDQLTEDERWEAQAKFWRAIVGRAKSSPAIFCWNLMNEPVVPGGKRSDRQWLGPPFAGKHFVQFITLDQAGRERSEIATAWIKELTSAIREIDTQHLITVGLVDWSLDRPGLTSGFVPEKIASDLDFISVHLYPQSGRASEDRETLKGFQIGKPVVIEECFPLRCSISEQKEFLKANRDLIDGWISFYWGETPEDLERQKTIPAAILRDWLMHLPE